MTNNQLLVRLKSLHEELSAINTDLKATNEIDEQTVDALGQLVTDASVLIDHAKAMPTGAVGGGSIKDDHQDLLDRVADFEAHHPRVTKFLTQMTDFLAMIGI